MSHLLTEEEAKQRWCHEKFTASGGTPYCIGSLCMAWRFKGDRRRPTGKQMMIKVQDPYSASGYRHTSDIEVEITRTGYCSKLPEPAA